MGTVAFGTNRRIFALTWGIPHEFGGLTSVLLHRTKNLKQETGRPVPILTLDSSMDLPSTASDLVDKGWISSPTDIRNLWSEVAEYTDAQLRAFTTNAQGLERPFMVPGKARETGNRREYLSTDGDVLAVTHLRPDGTVVVADDRQYGKRRFIVFDTSGVPLGRWTKASDLYFAWLDMVTAGTESVVINDSKFVGTFLHKYRRPNVLLAQALHSTHMNARATSAFGPFTPSRMGVLTNNEQYDLMAFLTDQQRREFQQAFGDAGNAYVLPNSRPEPKAPVSIRRNPGAGVMLSRLSDEKRVEHAIRAMSVVRATGEHPGTTLTVFGSGKDEDTLRRLVSAEGLEDTVDLAGYRAGAAQSLPDYSFLVLSSKFEGLPLVLVEAMAAGCIPIAYDIRYGPADVIQDGVNGFLVPEGDVDALAERIMQVATMPEARLESMREAALARSKDFSDPAVTRMWLDALDDASRARIDHAPGPQLDLATTSVELRDSTLVVEVEARTEADWDRRPLSVDVVGRRIPYMFTETAEVKRSFLRRNRRKVTIEVDLDKCVAPPRSTYDLHLRFRGEPLSSRRRVEAPPGFERLTGGPVKIYSTVSGNLSIEIVRRARPSAG